MVQPAGNLALTIENVQVNNMAIYKFRNDKALRLFNITSLKGLLPSNFSIIDSYMGKAEFYSIDFSGFDNLHFTDAHLTECSFVNIKWKYGINSLKINFTSEINKNHGFIVAGRHTEIDTDKNALVEKILNLKNKEFDYFERRRVNKIPEVRDYFMRSREIYRQLKYALGKQGDIVNEQKFHALEMRAYNWSLSWKNNFWTKLAIKFSYWFSDFGQSIWRPLLWLFTGHFILFIFLLASGNFGQGLWLSIHPTWQGFQTGVEKFFKLINPLRRDENAFSGFSVLTDLLMRIWSSYMIYNIVRAARRFIK
jgi:hypothetical protein